jgi:sialic acid synthase SpsE|tara:strand:- start:2344 stop:3051 length:708 start_codon:yes stop_codon:yes gene_type:complete
VEIVVDLFNQHSGNLNELKRMALSAYLNGADVAKIQILNSKRIWGDDSRKYLEMTYDEVKDFYNFCNSHSIEPWATVFDEKSLEWIVDLNTKRFKIASVTAAKDKDLCEKILSYNKETIISLGMYNDEFPFGHDKNIKYLYCVSEYPTYLYNKKLRNMPKVFNDDIFSYYGYSDHAIGITPALQSYLRGAKLLEKHFTFNNFNQRETEKANLGAFTPDSLRQFKNLINEFEILES